MGAVWLARHRELEVEVALKFLRTEQGGDGKAEERFRREARAAAQLKSPHVVQIHDFGIDSGAPYIAMELLQGEDLCSRLDREGALPFPVAVEILMQAAKGLRIAHQNGIVHRDIKPSNIFLSDSAGEVLVKILDFGIAKAEMKDGVATTTEGLVFGSPAYMSPEQARAGQVDFRSDLWSLGAVYYEMLTGKAPFTGSNASDVVVKLCTEDVPAPSVVRPELGAKHDAFFVRALSRDLGRRFGSVDEMLSALGEEQGRPIDAQRTLSVLRGAGRLEETAPLVSPFKGEGSGPMSVVPGGGAVLRPSLLPERPPPSEARGILAVGGVLLSLGILGLWMTKAERRVNPPPPSLEVRPLEGSARLAPHQEAEPGAVVSTVASESPSEDRTGDSRSLPLVPSVPATAERPPQARPPQARPPAPSPARKKPVKPATDPVFGLPVDAP